MDCDLPYREQLLSINQARNCLTHRSGVVGQADAREDPNHQCLVVKYFAPELVCINSNGVEQVVKPGSIIEEGLFQLRRQNTPKEKVFRVGTRVGFSTQDFYDMIETIWLTGATYVDRLIQRSQL